MHDPRIGRFFTVDPLVKKYPHNAPYAFSENRVIDGVELEGLEYAKFNLRLTDGFQLKLGKHIWSKSKQKGKFITHTYQGTGMEPPESKPEFNPPSYVPPKRPGPIPVEPVGSIAIDPGIKINFEPVDNMNPPQDDPTDDSTPLDNNPMDDNPVDDSPSDEPDGILRIGYIVSEPYSPENEEKYIKDAKEFFELMKKNSPEMGYTDYDFDPDKHIIWESKGFGSFGGRGGLRDTPKEEEEYWQQMVEKAKGRGGHYKNE